MVAAATERAPDMTAQDTMRTRHARLPWTSDRHVEIGGVQLEFNWDFSGRPMENRLMVLKHPDFLEEYMSVIGDRLYPRVLELGVFDGGSCFLFTELLGADRLVAVDIIGGSPRFDEFRAASPMGERISVHYGVSQDDEGALTRIVDSEFDAPLDLVIDDASHWLQESTRSFEILFPRLAPGGWYVLEDWSWAHFHNSFIWPDKHSLAVMTMKLLFAWVAHPEIISDVVVKRHTMFVRKAMTAPVGGTLSLDALCEMNGRELRPF